MRTESVRTIAPFWGGKRCGVDVPLYAANCGKLESDIGTVQDMLEIATRIRSIAKARVEIKTDESNETACVCECDCKNIIKTIVFLSRHKTDLYKSTGN